MQYETALITSTFRAYALLICGTAIFTSTVTGLLALFLIVSPISIPPLFLASTYMLFKLGFSIAGPISGSILAFTPLFLGAWLFRRGMTLII